MIMNTEDRELMMKDLCGRLPYGVVITDGIHKLKLKVRLDTAPGTMEEFFRTDTLRYYLRPMSSMTWDERFEYDKFVNGNNTLENHANEIDWLNAHHFDYRGLIEKGIALEAPDGVYTVVCRNINEKTDIRAKTPFFDKNGVRIYDGDVFVYVRYTNFKDGVPLDLIENYSKYENEVVLHPVFWDDDKKLWCSDVYGDCDSLASYDFNEVVVVTNINEHPELYNH
jgi:hypothetical protein